MWPFGRKKEKRMVLLPTVTLTDEEHRECQAYLTSVIPQTDEGAWYMPAELIEPFKRNLTAVCMMGRAKRFAILRQQAEACQAAAKACSIYPMYLHFYDYACILESLGNDTDAKMMFAEFLRRHDAGPQNEVEQSFDKLTRRHRDVPTMVRDARNKVGT
jgi:hypothetical protein